MALVLCGGGSRGALEIGFYRALVEMGVPLGLIVGSSIGALNGAFIAAGVSVNEIYELWRSVRFRDIFGLNWRSLLHPRKADSIYDNRKLRRFLERHLPAKRFEDLRMPLTIVATDLETGECVRLERGDLIEAVLASVAIPGLLPPVWIAGRQLIDGGIANNLPLDVAVEKGTTAILAIRCGCPLDRKGPICGIVSILSRSFDIAGSAKYQQDLRRYNGQSELIILKPCLEFEVGLLDFSHSAELLDLAYDLTMRERAALARLIIDEQETEGEAKAAKPAFEPALDRNEPAAEWELVVGAL